MSNTIKRYQPYLVGALFFFIAFLCEGSSVDADITCYPSTPEFLNAPPAGFPATTQVSIESMDLLRKRYGLEFPASEGYEPFIQPFEIYSRNVKENAITSSQSSVPRIIEFKNPVKVFGMFVENFGDREAKADARFEITFVDGTMGSCVFPDPDPFLPEVGNPIENKWYRFFGVTSDVPIARITFSNVSDPSDGFRIWGLRISR